MREPVHSILQPGARWTTERMVGVGFVALLHVIAIWAILSGLAQKFVKAIEPPPITWVQPVTQPPPPQPAPRLPHVDPTDPTTTTVIVPPPIFTIQDGQTHVTGSTDAAPSKPSVPDTSASGITSTHGVPDYPPLARRLGEQGSVQLNLTISATGEVLAANIVQSSGFADLDQTAVSWVIAHWKYTPATQNGVAIASQTQAVVVFSLKNAR